MNSHKYVTKDGIDFSALVSAFDQFHDGLTVAKTDLEKAGTIQYFEFTYELAWKTLRRILKERGKDLNSPKTVFREAALEKLIENPETWFNFIEDRNQTVHTYNKSKANSIFQQLPLFDAELVKLLNVLKSL